MPFAVGKMWIRCLFLKDKDDFASRVAVQQQLRLQIWKTVGTYQLKSIHEGLKVAATVWRFSVNFHPLLHSIQSTCESKILCAFDI